MAVSDRLLCYALPQRQERPKVIPALSISGAFITMAPRETRKQRREAERKARKLANRTGYMVADSPSGQVRGGESPQELTASPSSPTPEPQPHPATAAYFAEMRAKADRELEDEFGADFIAYSREVSDRIATRAGLNGPARNRTEGDRPERLLVTNTASENPMGQDGSRNALSPASPRGQVNRENSRHSTGPRTPEGKLASSRNSTKHGLASGVPVIPGEDPAEFETLRNSLLREHQPADATEQILIDQLAQSYWLLQRAIRFQNDCFTPQGVDEKCLALFIRYGSTHERAFHKALNTLLRLKRDRRKTQPAPRQTQITLPDGFVSQKQGPPPPEPSTSGFVSQIDGSLEPSSAHFSEISARKSPGNAEKLPDAA